MRLARLYGPGGWSALALAAAAVFVVFPVLKPINIVVLVITVIESLRAFDIAYIINRGKNGLELLSILVTNNLIGEASLVGFGSAIAVVLLMISVGPIVYYLIKSVRAEAT